MLMAMLLRGILWQWSPLLTRLVVALLCKTRDTIVIVIAVKGLAIVGSMALKKLDTHLCFLLLPKVANRIDFLLVIAKTSLRLSLPRCPSPDQTLTM